MPDVLIRNFPAEDLNLLDEQAARLGISRSEYLRRHLHREARRTVGSVTVADLRALGDLVADLADDAVMSDAWS
ncbi:MAG: type II toxin-antitoxin system VapB family antitoxin [Cellulomonas sp.]